MKFITFKTNRCKFIELPFQKPRKSLMNLLEAARFVMEKINFSIILKVHFFLGKKQNESNGWQKNGIGTSNVFKLRQKKIHFERQFWQIQFKHSKVILFKIKKFFDFEFKLSLNFHSNFPRFDSKSSRIQKAPKKAKRMDSISGM